MTIIYQKSKINIITFILVAIIPFIFTATWLLKNTQLPTSDAANFLSTSIDIYSQYHEAGFWNGFASAYSIRGWRPIFFPVFLVPFLIIFKGNIELAWDVVGLLSCVFTIIYLYIYFRLVLNRALAILASGFIAILPHVQTQILGFYAESLLFPCIIASTYHLIKSSYLSSKMHAWGFACFFSFALLIRPVEAILHLFLVFAVFLTNGYLKGKFWKKDIINTFFLLFIGLGLFCSSIKWHGYSISDNRTDSFNIIANALLLVSFAGLILFGSFAYIMSRYERKQYGLTINSLNSTYLLKVFIVCITVTLLWYLPYAYETFEWIYQTSFGTVAAGTMRSAGNDAGFLEELKSHFTAEGNFAVYSIVLLALFSLLILSIKERMGIFKSTTISYLVLITIIPILEISFTVQDILRKTCIALPVLLMALLMVGLWPGRCFRIRSFLFVLIFAMQLTLLVYTIFINPVFNPSLNNLVGYYLRPPIIISPNPHSQVEKFLDRNATRFKFKQVDLEVNPYTMEPVDPFLLNIIIRAKSNGYNATYMFLPTYDTSSVKEMRNKTDAILLSDNINDMNISNLAKNNYFKKMQAEKTPNMKLRYQYLFHYADNTLDAIGWKVVECAIIKSGCFTGPPQEINRTTDCRACILIPT